jgi:hypothetical protein
MSVEPLGQVCDHFSEVVDRVERYHERVTLAAMVAPSRC